MRTSQTLPTYLNEGAQACVHTYMYALTCIHMYAYTNFQWSRGPLEPAWPIPQAKTCVYIYVYI